MNAAVTLMLAAALASTCVMCSLSEPFTLKRDSASVTSTTGGGGIGGATGTGGGAEGAIGGGGTEPVVGLPVDEPPPMTPVGLSDDFNTPDVDETIWSEVQSPLLEQQMGVLRYGPKANAAGSQYAAMRSTSLYDMRGLGTWIEIVEVADQIGQGLTYIELYQAHANKATMRIDPQGLRFVLTLDGRKTAVVTPFDPEEHRWLRFRDDGSMLHFDTSADGDNWLVWSSVPSPPFLESVGVHFGAASNPGNPMPSQAAFDNVNVAPSDND